MSSRSLAGVRKTLAAAALGLGIAAASLPSQAADQFVPLANFRLGPLASIGATLSAGWIDYMSLINDRDGGVYGHKLVWEECEFEYKPDRAIECYERMKNRVPTGMPFFNTLNTPATYALTERAAQDKVPLITVGIGRADAADGRVFPWVFPLMTTYQSGNTAMVQYIAGKEGGIAKLKGKKIAFIYHDTAFGKEELPVLELQQKKYGFELIKIPIAPPGAEQQSHWLQIRQAKPDWIIMRTLGVMTVSAIKNAQRIGFPREKMIAGWWSGTTDDMLAAGEAAKGYNAISLYADGADFPVIKEIVKRYYTGDKKGNLADPKLVGSSNYNAGIAHGIVMVELIRAAMDKYGKKPVTGEQVRWALERINLDDKRMKELGAAGLVQPLKTSCQDHEGGGSVKVHQWDGTTWVGQGGWVKSDRALVRPLLEELAAGYAKEKGITPRDCSKEK
ncbi:MAG: hypothetical protein AMXMBFR6_12180 [Betaproteobacteria bacterium]|nr:hypothetical protein [Rhodocyclaceae bacterium]